MMVARVLAAGTLAVGLVLANMFAGAPAAMAADPLLVVTPDHLVVAMPLPGQTSAWEISASNPGQDAVGMMLVVTGPSDTDSAEIDRHVQLTVTANTDFVVQGTVAELRETPIPLDPLSPGQDMRISAKAYLPHDAGNELQGLSSSVVLQIIATGEVSSPDVSGVDRTKSAISTLPVTGVGLGLFGIALISIMGGLTVVMIRRRKEDRREGDSAQR